MPSLNHYARISDGRRIRVNVGEGTVHVQVEEYEGRGHWKPVRGSHLGPLSREHAEALANAILSGLKAGY